MKKSVLVITLVIVIAVAATMSFIMWKSDTTASTAPSTPAKATEAVTMNTSNEFNSQKPQETHSEAAVETTVPPTIDVNEALTNVWRIVENDCVEEIPILPGLLLDDIKDWMETTEFKEARLYQRTNWNTVRLGIFGDMAVAQISMDDEDLVWNVRMEKSDKRENKTNIVIPEDASTGENPLDSTNTTEQYFFWENGDGTCSELYLVYFEDTQNLYTIYTNEMVFTRKGDSWDCNSRRGPTVILKPIENENLGMYSHITEDEIRAAKGKNDIRYFRIQTTDSCETYQYRFGSTVGEWVNSKFNTDGWHIVYEKGKPYVVSADNRFMLNYNDYVWRTMKAGVYHYSAD